MNLINSFPLTAVALLMLSSNIHAATYYGYTFTFDTDGSYGGAVIQYASTQAPENMTSLHYVAGSVNGCSPSTLMSYMRTSTARTFEVSGTSTDCAPVIDSVVEFNFSVENLTGIGNYSGIAGRGVQASEVLVMYHYTSGSLLITEDVSPDPQSSVPEPGTAGLAIGGIVGLSALVLLKHHRSDESLVYVDCRPDDCSF